MVSLWFVKTYLAARLVAVNDAMMESFFDADDDPLPDAKRIKIKARLEWIVGELEFLGLKFTKVYAQRLVMGVPTGTADEISDRVGILRDRFDDELKGLAFLHLKSGAFEQYGDPFRLWGIAADNFRSAVYDMEEASKCFALQRFTASVLHSMRVLEAGLRVSAITLGVTFEEKEWQKILNDLQGELNRRESLPSAQKPSNWKDERQFYSEAFLEFKYFKDAWRNYAAHGRTSYDEERAEVVRSHVASFMRHLATKLKE